MLQRSGFAGTSRLSNMGTGLWRRHAWTTSLLETWWQERGLLPAFGVCKALEDDPRRNEQEVGHRLSLSR